MKFKSRWRRGRSGACKRKTRAARRIKAELQYDEPLIADLMLGGSSARAAVTAAHETRKARNMVADSQKSSESTNGRVQTTTEPQAH